MSQDFWKSKQATPITLSKKVLRAMETDLGEVAQNKEYIHCFAGKLKDFRIT